MIHQDDITIINTYALNVGALSFIRQTLLDANRQMSPDTIIVHDFNTPTHINSSFRQKNQLRNFRVKLHRSKSNTFNRHL
jgi:hypothetical protein